MDVATFRKKYEKDIEAVEKQDQLNFNVFKILGLTNYEIRHSNFLKWLFNKKEFRKEFLNRFKKELEKVGDLDDEIDADSDVEVEREKYFEEIDENGNSVYRWKDGKKVYYRVSDKYYTLENTPENMLEDMSKKKTGKVFKHDISLESLQENKKFDKKKFTPIGRYIDINIIGDGDNFTLTIENKIDSGEHDFQCVAYRNYMLNNYKDKKKHYFVFLAKSKPDDFDEGRDEKNGRYPEYVFMDYKMIVEILELENVKKEFESPQSNKVEGEIVQQYINMIKEWEHMPKEYKDICSKIDIQPFEEDSDYKEFIESKELTESEKRFVEVAHQYYRELKNSIDEFIKPVICNMSIDEHYIKDDYDRGSYAIAIPLSLDIMSDKGKYKYLYSKKEITENKYNLLVAKKEQEILEKKTDDIIDIIKRINNEKKCLKSENQVFQTVDYRAPMGKCKNPSISIGAGLSTEYSENLCVKLADNAFVEEIKKLDNNGWTVKMNFYYKNGAGYNKNSREVDCDSMQLLNMTAKERENHLNAKSVFGKKHASDVFSTEFLGYLNSLKGKDKDKGKDKKLLNVDGNKQNKQFEHMTLSEWMNDLIAYFTSHGEEIEERIKLINSFLKVNDYQNKFEVWKKKINYEERYNESNIQALIKNLIKPQNEDDTFNDDTFKTVIKTVMGAVRITLFREWLQSEDFDELEFLSIALSLKEKKLHGMIKNMIENLLSSFNSKTDDESDSKSIKKYKGAWEYVNKFLNYKGFKERYESWLRTKKIYGHEDELIKKFIGKPHANAAKKLSTIIFVDSFLKWAKQDKEFNDTLSELEGLKKQVNINSKGNEIANWIREINGGKKYIDSKNRENVKHFLEQLIEDEILTLVKDKVIKSLIAKEFSYTCSSVYFGWNLTLLHESDDVFAWMNNYELSDEEVMKEKEKTKTSLTEFYYNKTLEGVTPFGYDGCRYDGWFKEQVFKSKEELGLQ